MKHRLLFGDVAFYEAAMVDILQKYPPSASRVVITIREAGKGSEATVREVWPPGTKSAADIAKFVARKIVQAYTDHSERAFDSVPASGLIVNGFAPLELSRLCGGCKKLSGDAAIYQRRREDRRHWAPSVGGAGAGFALHRPGMRAASH